jgi:flavin-dependent dehydrogenase
MDNRSPQRAKPEYDVVVAGGGPAGMASAIAAAIHGMRVVVCERRTFPVDKACGEGLMPPAVRALQALGVRDLIGSDACRRIAGVRLLEADGPTVEAPLPAPRALGVRRLALSAALERRARSLGVQIREACTITGCEIHDDRAIARTMDGREIGASVIVAADGLHSRLRAMVSPRLPARGPCRFGTRQHFRISPWSEFVEVYLADGMEAYVTPVASDEVGIAILWRRGPLAAPSLPEALGRFPALASRIRGAQPVSQPRGAGPMLQRVGALVSDRIVLAGDAAGYIDAITGEGLSLALAAGISIGRILPRAVTEAGVRSLLAYQREVRRRFRRYALSTRIVMAAARLRPIRRGSIAMLSAAPRVFQWILDWTFADTREYPQTSAAAIPSYRQVRDSMSSR